MKSIRLSLIVYFLILFAAALGAVWWSVYQTSAAMVRKSADSKRLLLQEQYSKLVKEAETALDKSLADRARALARLPLWSHDHAESICALGVLGSLPQPHGHLSSLVWLLENFPENSQANFVYRMTPREMSVELAEALVPGEYLQINGQDTQLIARSEALDREIALPQQARDLDQFNVCHETVRLGSGLRLRAVAIKVSFPKAHPSVLPDPFRGRGNRFQQTDKTGERRGGPRMKGFGPPTVYFLLAKDLKGHDKNLADFQNNLDTGLAQVTDDSDDILASVRTRLLWISGIAFVALAVGGFWLVRLGLTPLARVSEAVSRVSEKDFRLQVEDRRLPSELQPIVERLKQTLEQLQRAFAREKQAAADISHELRTPLAALLTTLDVGLRKERSTEEYHELLRECRAAGQQMSHLVERLLALARLDAGVDHLRPRDVDAGQVAEECAAMVRPLAEAREVRLRVRREGPTYVRTDPDKLREIVTNLLHNAIQYNRPHGEIDVAVNRHNGNFDVQVQDTGIGIPPDVKEQIFERFYRADASRNADDLHAGLGLAIVKGYVDLMGGTIQVDSKVGQGSTFRVRLPAGV
jgi:heavy metal sensor kinase